MVVRRRIVNDVVHRNPIQQSKRLLHERLNALSLIIVIPLYLENFQVALKSFVLKPVRGWVWKQRRHLQLEKLCKSRFVELPHEISMATVVIVLVNESQCDSIAFFLVAIYKQVFVFECAKLLFKVLDGEVSFDLLVNEVVNGVEALGVDDLDTFFVHHFHSRDQSRDVLHITVAF